MGYRSDVKLILTDKGMDMMKAKVPEPTEDGLYWMAEPIYRARRVKGKYWLIEWYYTKWYERHAESAVPYAVAQTLAELNSINEPYSFMRIGEEYDDIDIMRCDGENWRDTLAEMPSLHLARKIEVEY